MDSRAVELRIEPIERVLTTIGIDALVPIHHDFATALAALEGLA